jgi:hypothetical protein
MEQLRSRSAIVGALAVLGALLVVLVPGKAGGGPDEPPNNILARALAIEKGQIQPTKIDKPLSAGVMQALYGEYGGGSGANIATARASASSGASSASFDPPTRGSGTNGCPNVFEGRDGPDNIRVNQDCSLRRQAEEWVGVNPRDFSNILAGQNDSVIGFNHCGYDWSLNRARTWGSVGTAPPPFWQTILADGHTSDACSDPAASFDHLGNAYITGVLFDVGSAASAVVVAKSNWPIKGRFYHSPSPGPFQEYSTTPMGLPANDNDPNIFHDKELMIADSRPGSPKKGNVYVTWTRFATTTAGVGANSPIVFSQSTNGGSTWSAPVIISGSASFCTDFSGSSDPHACDQDQGSDPVVGPDGTIYVIFGNGNLPGLGIEQVLMVKCPAGSDCSNSASWSAPVKIGDLIETHPLGPSPNGCPAGRQCLPPNGYRAPAITTLTISVDRNSNLYATWVDHRNNSNPACELPTVGGSPPCDHDVFYAYSTNRGATWSSTINVTPRSRLGETAQWQSWSDVMGDGSKVQVAFYDRHYGNCETSGCNDITLATISNPRTASPTIRYQRITTASMPNLTTENNPVQAGFLGDYMWVEVSRHSFDQKATHIVWADTRQLFGPAPEEDIYYARIGGGDDDDD